MMPEPKLTAAVEKGVDSALLRLRNRRGTWWKVLVSVIVVLAIGYGLGAHFGMPAVG